VPQIRLRKTGPAGVVVLLASLLWLAPASALAQGYPPPNTPPPPAQTAVFSPQQLDQLLAPVALYPDPLLAQVLMAATYPLDVVAADRWVHEAANSQISGDALAAALEPEPWDPSVKSLVPFPQILAMMDVRLDWLQSLGDAFLVQPDDVMAAVQRLRQAARASGTLVSTPQETVEVQDGTIVIMPANPDVVYVPAYNPESVYGVWPYPDYPPVYIPPPPGFVVSGFFFSVGIPVIAPLWGWGDFDWHRRVVHIDRDRFNRLNRGRPPVTGDTWHFDPLRRGAVPYRDPRNRAQYQRPLPGPAPSRDFRGYPPAQQAARPVPQAQPEVARPAVSAPQRRQTASPYTAARPVPMPQVFRPTPSRSVFRPSIGAEARAYAQRGAESRAAPVARPAPMPHFVPAMRPAPMPRPAPVPQGGMHR
jgi:hypothetical protein